jgi:hypothetical protein
MNSPMGAGWRALSTTEGGAALALALARRLIVAA